MPSLEGRTFNSVFRADGHAPDGQVRYRIAGSGSTSWATESPTTASIVAAITEAGIAVRNVSMGSAATATATTWMRTSGMVDYTASPGTTGSRNGVPGSTAMNRSSGWLDYRCGRRVRCNFVSRLG